MVQRKTGNLTLCKENVNLQSSRSDEKCCFSGNQSVGNFTLLGRPKVPSPYKWKESRCSCCIADFVVINMASSAITTNPRHTCTHTENLVFHQRHRYKVSYCQRVDNLLPLKEENYLYEMLKTWKMSLNWNLMFIFSQS